MRWIKLSFLLLAALMIFGLGSGQETKLFTFEFQIDRDGEVSNVRSSTAVGYTRIPGEEDGKHTLKLLNKNKSVINTYRLRISYLRLGKNVEKVNSTRVFFRLPYNPKAEFLEISKEENFNTLINIPSNVCKAGSDKCTEYCEGREMVLSCTCGDDICQEDLNEDELCPQDCETPSQPNQQDQEGDNEANQEDQSDTVNTSQEQPVEVVDSGTNTGILVLIGILFILVALVLASGKVSIEA